MVNESNGWLFESRSVEQLAEALGEVAATSDSILSDAGRNGRRLIEQHYTADTYAQHIMSLYSRMQGKNPVEDCDAPGATGPVAARRDSTRISL